MENFATVEDLKKLWRALKFDEEKRAEVLFVFVTNSLGVNAK